MGGIICVWATAVQGGVEVGAPAPKDRAKGLGGGIGGLDGGCISPGLVAQLVVRGWVGMHIPVGAVPQHGLIIQVVEHHSAAGGAAVRSREVVDPAGDESRGNGEAG